MSERPRAMFIVSVDCATLPTKTGLALATYENGTLTVRECRIAGRRIPMANQIHAWIKAVSRAPIALDSPLGWPVALAENLARHHAGAPSQGTAGSRRRPNCPHRTAVAALSLLENLSRLIGTKVPLAWQPWRGNGVRAIEVYPAGTLRSSERTAKTATGGETTERKRDLLRTLEAGGRIRFTRGLTKALANEHVLDSVICTVAAVDLLERRVIQPTTAAEKARSRKEGWIYVRDPSR